MAETAGQMVKVTTPAMGGGPPLRSAVVVAEPDPKKAEDLVRAMAAPNEIVEAVGPLTANVLKLFDLKPEQFTAWR